MWCSFHGIKKALFLKQPTYLLNSIRVSPHIVTGKVRKSQEVPNLGWWKARINVKRSQTKLFISIFPSSQVFIHLHFPPNESILDFSFLSSSLKAYLTFLPSSFLLLSLIFLLFTSSDRKQERMFQNHYLKNDYFPVRKMLSPLKSLMVSPKTSTKIKHKGAVAQQIYFQKLFHPCKCNLLMQITHSVCSKHSLHAVSLEEYVCTWKMTQNVCLLIILLFLFCWLSFYYFQ